MKLYTVFFTVCTALLLAGCYDDKGNYDYLNSDEVMSVKIESLGSELTAIANSLMEITPQLTHDDTGRYTYLWYTIANAYPYTKEILSTDRDLSIICNLTVGKYTLYYLVKDEALDLYKSVSAPLTVTATDITSGWYVLKETDESVDIDYFSLEGNDRDDLLANVLNIEPLQGHPIGIAFAPNSYAHETENPDGTVTRFTGQSVLHIASNKDLISLNASDMSLFKTLEDQFYEMPGTINFQSIDTDYYDDFFGTYQVLINNNNLHSVGRASGRFGYQLAGDYQIHPDLIYGYFGSYFYDQKNYKMYFAYVYDSDYTEEMTSLFGSSIDFYEDRMELIRLLPRQDKYFMCNAYGLFNNKGEGKYYLIDFGFYDRYFYPDPTYYELSERNLLPQATVMAAPQSASVVYFALDNTLMAHKVTSGTEETIKTFDSDERITYLKHFTEPGTFNDLVVATHSSSGYKIYRFPLIGSAGEIDTNHSPSMSGTGEAAFVLYRNE